METTRYSVPFSPLQERIAREAPQLSAALNHLQQAMGASDFEKYINSLSALKKVDDHLLLITKKEMYRSVLTGRFLSVIKECFAVKFVRIVSQ